MFDSGQVTHSEVGTPQGGVLSPLLANIYLHEVLDVWFEDVVTPRLKGPVFLIRYADDVIIVCGQEDDARCVAAVVPKRFGHYALTLHPEKTRLHPFRRPRTHAGPTGTTGEQAPGSFDFLGLTHGWRRSRRGWWVVGQRTAKGCLSRALTRANAWCREHRHQGLAVQQGGLSLKLRGHYGYYGVTGNLAALRRFYVEVQRRWYKWLRRRSQRARMARDRFQRLLQRYPLPWPIVVQSIYRRPANPCPEEPDAFIAHVRICGGPRQVNVSVYPTLVYMLELFFSPWPAPCASNFLGRSTTSLSEATPNKTFSWTRRTGGETLGYSIASSPGFSSCCMPTV